MRFFARFLLVGSLAVLPAAAQNGITIEPLAGLSIPTDSDFGDFFNTGMVLGARVGYQVADNVDVTVGATYNRFKSDDFSVGSAAAKSSGIQGVSGSVTWSILAPRAGVRYTIPTQGTVGFHLQADVGLARQKEKFGSFESESESDLLFGVGGAICYHFTPTAAVTVGPMFNYINAEETYHFLDVFVSVIFGL